MEYLPHMRMDGPLEGWPRKDAVEQASINMYLYFANPLNAPLLIQVNPRTNDSFSNAEVTCSNRKIVITKWDPAERTIWPKPMDRKMSGEYTYKNMLAFPLTVNLKDRTSKRLEFILDIDLRCEIRCSDGDTKNANLRYPLEITVKRTEQKHVNPKTATRTRHRPNGERRMKPAGR